MSNASTTSPTVAQIMDMTEEELAAEQRRLVKKFLKRAALGAVIAVGAAVAVSFLTNKSETQDGTEETTETTDNPYLTD